MNRQRALERYEVPLAVAAGGALGALARWGLGVAAVSGVAADDALAAGMLATLAANITGSLALGVVLVVAERVGHRRAFVWTRLWRSFMATGVLGGFTTFSTVELELLRLDGRPALAYLVVSVVLGLAAFGAGNALARKGFGVTA